MKIKYYPDTDTMLINLRPGLAAEVLPDAAPGVAVDVDADGNWLRIEIYEAASKKVNLTSLQVDGLGFPVPAIQEAAG